MSSRSSYDPAHPNPHPPPLTHPSPSPHHLRAHRNDRLSRSSHRAPHPLRRPRPKTPQRIPQLRRKHSPHRTGQHSTPIQRARTSPANRRPRRRRRRIRLRCSHHQHRNPDRSSRNRLRRHQKTKLMVAGRQMALGSTTNPGAPGPDSGTWVSPSPKSCGHTSSPRSASLRISLQPKSDHPHLRRQTHHS